MKLEGVVRFRDPPPKLSDATVRVRLSDTSRADASSETVAEQTIEGVSLESDGAGDGVRFAFFAPELRPGRSYSLAAHVDVSCSGEIEAGDHITMESVPVEPRSAGTQLEITVCQVRS
jgi:uncharacterized lipoprotein YbaY